MSRLGMAGATVAVAVALAASPLTLNLGAAGAGLVPSYAFAKHGRDDRAGDDRGGGRDDKAGDDRGRGRDDRGKDDRRGRGRDDDSRPGGSTAKPGGGVAKVEREDGGIEITWGNGVKEEIEGGRYQLKNAAGRTVVERPATAADRARLRAAAAR